MTGCCFAVAGYSRTSTPFDHAFSKLLVEDNVLCISLYIHIHIHINILYSIKVYTLVGSVGSICIIFGAPSERNIVV